MSKIPKNEKGFSAVEGILVVVIVALIGVVGWLVYKDNHKTTTSVANTASTSKPATSTSTKNTTAAINPYAGWKSFCSSQGGLCLKYPSSWTLVQDVGNTYSDTVTSPSGSVVVNYWPTGTPGGAGSPTQETIHVQSVTPAASSNYEAVGLAYTDNELSTPSYGVNLFVTSIANAAYYSGYSASNGDTKYTSGDAITSSGAPNNYQFSNPVTGETQYLEQLVVTGSNASTTDDFSSLSAAEAWLSTPEVQTATQILASANTN